MKIISEKEFEKLNNTVLTIGKFDGLHKGHQMLLDKLVQYKDEGYKTVLFTFKKAPREILDMEESDYILNENEKISFLDNEGIDYYIQYPCDAEVLSTTAEDFIEKIIVGRIGARKIVCGTDFRFGKNRAGDVQLLKSLEEKYGYKVIVLDKLQYNDSDISSSRIRQAAKDGNMELVNELLGYTYSIVGQVIDGRKIGRNLGFPTANMVYDNKKVMLPFGVYYTRANIDGISYKGVTNVGVKPTVNDEGLVNVETCFLDYEGDLYGKVLELKFYKYVRAERKFDSLEALKNQINSDVCGCMKFEY